MFPNKHKCEGPSNTQEIALSHQALFRKITTFYGWFLIAARKIAILDATTGHQNGACLAASTTALRDMVYILRVRRNAANNFGQLSEDTGALTFRSPLLLLSHSRMMQSVHGRTLIVEG